MTAIKGASLREWIATELQSLDDQEAAEARAADPYAYQRRQERKKPKVVDLTKSVVHEAAFRLGQYVEKYPEYTDRDRDIILLHLLSLAEKCTP